MVARARKTDCILNFDASQSGKRHRARKQLADRPNCARAGARSSNAHMAAVGPDVGILGYFCEKMLLPRTFKDGQAGHTAHWVNKWGPFEKDYSVCWASKFVDRHLAIK